MGSLNNQDFQNLSAAFGLRSAIEDVNRRALNQTGSRIGQNTNQGDGQSISNSEDKTLMLHHATQAKLNHALVAHETGSTPVKKVPNLFQVGERFIYQVFKKLFAPWFKSNGESVFLYVSVAVAVVAVVGGLIVWLMTASH